MGQIIHFVLILLLGVALVSGVGLIAGWSLLWTIVGGLLLGFVLSLVYALLCGLAVGLYSDPRAGCVLKSFAAGSMVATIYFIWTHDYPIGLDNLLAARIIGTLWTFWIYGADIMYGAAGPKRGSLSN